jgi:acyl-CoA reductase-like NAD-dependent aldehyde dehydrogenase
VITNVAQANAQDVDLAVAAAKTAFESGEWSQWQNPDRRNIIHKIADLIQQNAEELATIESTDNGKPFGMAMYDMMLSQEVLRYTAGWAEKIHG